MRMIERSMLMAISCIYGCGISAVNCIMRIGAVGADAAVWINTNNAVAPATCMLYCRPCSIARSFWHCRVWFVCCADYAWRIVPTCKHFPTIIAYVCSCNFYNMLRWIDKKCFCQVYGSAVVIYACIAMVADTNFVFAMTYPCKYSHCTEQHYKSHGAGRQSQP